MVKHGYYKIGDNYLNRLKKYNNILPIRYQKKFKFETYTFPHKKISHDNLFAGKTLLIGNFKEDYKEDKGFHGLHAIGYATQMLIDQDRGKDILVEFEDNILKILVIVILFSFIETYLAQQMLNLFKKLNKGLIFCISCMFSFSLFLALVWFMLQFSYLFADFTIVLSGIIASGVIFLFCWHKVQPIPVPENITTREAEPRKPAFRGRATEREVRVFISCADKDQEIAKKLFSDLKNSGVIPWLRFKDILPGQNRKDVIRQAIKTSSFFLALFSARSVSKKGIVHRKLKTVKDLADELPASDIFIIPVRLDECDLNDQEMEALEGIDLFQSYENGLKQILRVFQEKVHNPI